MKKVLLPTMLSAMLLAACNSNSAPADNTSHANSAATNKGVCKLVQGDTAGAGKKVVYRCDGRAVLNSAEAQEILANGAKIEFGGSGTVLNQKGLVTRQAANTVGKSDEASCERAFINAAKKFQETASKLGGTRVINFHSYYDRKPLKGGQYDCEVGTWHGRVVIKADVVR